MNKPFSRAASGRPTVGDALALATYLHAEQTDHAGKPYILHIRRVVDNLLKIHPLATDAEIMAAYLHDTIEDTIADKRDLLKMGYPEETVQTVMDVSKPPDDKREYAQVIDDLIATENRSAMLLKIADNMDNLHPERAAELELSDPAKAKRLGDRYRASIKKLCEAADIDYEMVMDMIRTAPPLEVAHKGLKIGTVPLI
jgi:(p)ppGpp synthase/HD superfamily hydrolase